jgi:hypothetical protein
MVDLLIAVGLAFGDISPARQSSEEGLNSL